MEILKRASFRKEHWTQKEREGNNLLRALLNIAQQNQEHFQNQLTVGYGYDFLKKGYYYVREKKEKDLRGSKKDDELLRLYTHKLKTYEEYDNAVNVQLVDTRMVTNIHIITNIDSELQNYNGSNSRKLVRLIDTFDGNINIRTITGKINPYWDEQYLSCSSHYLTCQTLSEKSSSDYYI